jgi:DNA-binding NarL/FixJ family response regulator
VKIMPEAKVIFLTMHADVVYVEEALSAGGMGYLLKRSAAAELTTAIHTVLRGNRYVTALIDSKESRMRRTDQWRSDGLTTRQRQVLQMVAEGCANKEIAVRLHVSEKTVDYHKSSIKRALKLSSTAELTQFAIKHRIIGV